MRKQSIELTAEEIQTLLETGTIRMRREIMPQPQPWPSNNAFLQWGSDSPKTLQCLANACPYGKPGDRFYLQESTDYPIETVSIQVECGSNPWVWVIEFKRVM
jgi:hypothetical protein